MRDTDEDTRFGAFSDLADDAIPGFAVEAEIIDGEIERALRAGDEGGQVLRNRRDLRVSFGTRHARLGALIEEGKLDLALGKGEGEKTGHSASPSGFSR